MGWSAHRRHELAAAEAAAAALRHPGGWDVTYVQPARLTRSLHPHLATHTEEATDMLMVAIGITLGLAGSIFINTGNNMQSLGMHTLEMEKMHEMKAELDRRQADNPHELALFDDQDEEEMGEIAPSQSKTWIAGTCIFVSGSLVNFAAFRFAPATILAPLEAIQFVSNLLFSYW